MARVLKLAFLDLARSGRLRRGDAFERLDAGLLVNAYDMRACQRERRRLHGERTDPSGLSGEFFEARDVRIEPVAAQVRAKVSVLLKNDRGVDRRCSLRF